MSESESTVMLTGFNLIEDADRLKLRVRASACLWKLRLKGNPHARNIQRNEAMFEAFICECLAEQMSEMNVSGGAVGGSIADAIAELIRSFIEDPEKWIKIIEIIIAMF